MITYVQNFKTINDLDFAADGLHAEIAFFY